MRGEVSQLAVRPVLLPRARDAASRVERAPGRGEAFAVLAQVGRDEPLERAHLRRRWGRARRARSASERAPLLAGHARRGRARREERERASAHHLGAVHSNVQARVPALAAALAMRRRGAGAHARSGVGPATQGQVTAFVFFAVCLAVVQVNAPNDGINRKKWGL